MTVKPILFSAPMVRALLAGNKTQSRRLLKPQPVASGAGLWNWEAFGAGVIGADDGELAEFAVDLTPHTVGDVLWVREAWTPAETGPAFAADHPGDPKGLGWKPSIHMPRWASRLTLVVTDVRVQRLQEISWEDALAEGIWHSSAEFREQTCIWRDAPLRLQALRIEHFAKLWNSINGPDAWDMNPWVAAYTFTVHHQNVDAFLNAKEAA